MIQSSSPNPMARYAIHNLVLIRKGYTLLVKNRRQAIISGKTSLCGQFPLYRLPRWQNSPESSLCIKISWEKESTWKAKDKESFPQLWNTVNSTVMKHSDKKKKICLPLCLLSKSENQQVSMTAWLTTQSYMRYMYFYEIYYMN